MAAAPRSVVTLASGAPAGRVVVAPVGVMGRLATPGPIDDGWLVRDGTVLASVEIPLTRRGKAIGLLGRDGIDGAMLLRPARSVHTFGLRFDLDVAFLDRDGVVVRMMRLHRNRLTPPVWRARSVIEAEAGAFGAWHLKIGDRIEVRVP